MRVFINTFQSTQNYKEVLFDGLDKQGGLE